MSKQVRHHARASLALTLCLLLTAEPLLLSGCGQREKMAPTEEEPPSVPTDTIQGVVDRTQLGGEGLEVVSVWDDPQRIEDNPTFHVQASSIGAQLLFLRDGAGNLRGLSVAVPNAGAARSGPVRFDVESTALGLLMMSPGISTTDPTQSTARMTALRGLPEFTDLSNRLDALGSSSLTELLQDPGVSEALGTCIRAWALADTVGARAMWPQADGAGPKFTAEVVAAGDLNNVILRLTNSGWRYLRVVQRSRRADGTAVSVVTLADGSECMRGAVPATWGDVFTSRAGTPTERHPSVRFDAASEVSSIEYWVEGPGFAPGSVEPPTSVGSEHSDAVLYSFTEYALVPFARLLVGAGTAAGEAAAFAKEAFTILKDGLDSRTVTRFIQARTDAERLSAGVNLLMAGVGVLAAQGATLTGGATLLGLSAVAWKAIAFGLAIGTIFMSAYNLRQVVDTWLTLPAISVVTIQNPGDVIPPARVTDLSTNEITATSMRIRWSAPGDDGNEGDGAASYDLRYSTQPATPWATMTTLVDEPEPRLPGDPESMLIQDLTPGTTYYFRLRSVDEAANWSGESNEAVGTTTGSTNTPPSPCATYNLEAGTTDTDFEFDCSCSEDAEDPASALKARWDWESDGTWDTEFQSLGAFTHRFAAPGSYQVKLQVQDTRHLVADMTVGRFEVQQGDDHTPPAPIADLHLISATSTSIVVGWTAVGDDSLEGTASQYDLRYSTETVGWALMTQAPGEPAPAPAGSSETFEINGLDPDTEYFIALETADEVPNWSNGATGLHASTLPDGGGSWRLAAYWPMDESAGDAIADVSGHGLDAVSNGADILPGYLGNCRSFHASEHDCVAGPGSDEAAWESERFDAWIRVRAVTGAAQVVVNHYLGFGRQLGIDAEGRPYALAYDGHTAARVFASEPLTVGVWTHLVAEFDDATARLGLSVDGKEVGSTVLPIGTRDPDAAVAIGCFPPAENGHFDGEIDEVRIFAGEGGEGDTTPPSAVTDLSVDSPTATTLRLNWTAVGDDGSVGTASSYDIRYSTRSSDGWDEMTAVSNPPSPSEAGQAESFVVDGLSKDTTYYFQMKVQDEMSNSSGVSNEVSGTTAQNPPPQGGFTLIPAGTFTMGSPSDEPCRRWDESEHRVTLTRSFYLSDHEVTQAEWRTVMGTDPPYVSGDTQPVTNVTWYDCINFCNEKSTRDGYQPTYTVNGDAIAWDATKNGYRLPTEAEWEYACRAGTKTALYDGGISGCEQDANMDRIGWYQKNSGWQMHDVRGKSPNVWGLFDMSGNVSEWCWDWYGGLRDSEIDPTGPSSGEYRALRGGSFFDPAEHCRSAMRGLAFPGSPGYGYYSCGFRLSRTVDPPDDAQPPARVANLAAGLATSSSLMLTWIAPGDDGELGLASQYDIRYTTSQSTVWEQMTQVSGEPTPKASGESESFVVTDLQPSTTYYFQMRVADEEPNWSALSNKAIATTAHTPQGSFVLIPAGNFAMGSPSEEACRLHEPQRQVTLTKSFFILDHEVTQAEWRDVMGSNPSAFTGDDHPVEGVSWHDCISFCNAKSKRDGYQPVYTKDGSTVTWDDTKSGYRLPTEAEWEYACRAGSTTAFYSGGVSDCHQDANMDAIGWYHYNSGGHTHDVRGKTANARGLYDMSGNVSEWCWDWYGSYDESVIDPKGPDSGTNRVVRGGCWFNSGAAECRSASRDWDYPGAQLDNLGFRLARTAP